MNLEQLPGRELSIALAALRAGDAHSALAMLDCRDALAEPPPAAWHALRGMALLADENWSAAKASLAAALAGGDRTPATALNCALADARLGDRAGAHLNIAQLERDHPSWDEPPFRLAELLREDGELVSATAAYERALAVAPTRPETLLRLATLHIRLGAPERAESLLVRCCGVAPTDFEAWDALGITCCLLSNRSAAHAAFHRAHTLNPDHVAIALRLAGTAAALQQSETELLRFEAESEVQPLRVAALAGRASLLCELGRDDEALQLLEAAAVIDPASADIAAFRAERLLRGSRHKEALVALRQAVALEPDDLGLRNNLAVALTRSHRYSEALELLDELAEREGDRIDMLCNRANALVCLGRQDEGVATARRATTMAHATPAERHLAWRTLANAMAYCETASGASLGPVLRTVAETAHRPPGEVAPTPAPRSANVQARLRVGLLSATLKTHPVGWLTLAGFENLDPAQFDIVCIAQREGQDTMQRRFRAAAAEWHPIADSGAPDLADRVRRLELDLLIDLSGYGDQGILGLCARRLAPVQIKWVGMQNHTTAMPEMDWFVTDRWETPPELAHHYSERLLLLPDGYVCYSPPVHAPAVAPLPALRRGHVTFGCFNNLAKITPLVIATWADILHRTPGARLVLKTHQLGDPATADSVRRSFVAQDIGPERLDLRGGSHHRELLAEYADIDLVLDPFPYSGGLTTCEAMWMGVPVLTCPGETFASRHSASHMSNVGLEDWVCADLPAYRVAAVRRVSDLPQLSSLRHGLRERMRQSPLCDAPRFGRNLGDALLRAWRER